MKPSNFISIKQVAWMLQVHELTVRRHYREWKLVRIVRNRRVILYDEAQVVDRFNALGFPFRPLS